MSGVRFRVCLAPLIACVLCDASIAMVGVDLTAGRAAQLVVGAQIIAVSVVTAVLSLAAFTRRRSLSMAVVAVAITVAAVAATPIPVAWDDGCNSHTGTTYAATAPYILVAQPEDTRLAFGGMMTLMACVPHPPRIG
jgi:hypothetical protein